MDKQFTIIPDVLWENDEFKELSPLGVNIIAHILRREGGEHKACTESVGNMAKRFHVSISTIKREIEKLATGGYISKEIACGVGWKLKTKLNMSPLNMSPNLAQYELEPSSKRTGSQLNMSYKETKEDTKKKQKKIKGDKSPKGKKCPSFSPFSSLPDGEVKEALIEYAKVRKGGKSPIKTERQEKLLLNKLQELAPNDRTKQVKIINEAIMRGWLSFYPLGEDKAKPPETRRNTETWSKGFNTRIV